MPWREVSIMEQRVEFVGLARQEGANIRALCRRFGISAQTGYKWLSRCRAGGDWAANVSRRPHASPGRIDAGLEAAVLSVRTAHPAWGARKIRRCLERDGLAAPSASTVHAVLARHGCIQPHTPRPADQRFEQPAPNLLWQMDFKGRFPMHGSVPWCHPLTIVDDHSRYALCLAACSNEQTATVQQRLTAVFRRYGLPEAFLVDNGSPWGDGPGQGWTRLGVWLLKLGVDVLHSRPYHPQTRGKNERFHRTLKLELLAFNHFRSLDQAQRAFDRWRQVYNFDRPHQALALEVPASRYRPSPRAMPTRLPKVEYGESEIVRTVGTTKAYISFKNRLWKMPQAFRGERLAVRPRGKDGCYAICFGAKQIAIIDLRKPHEIVQ